MSTRFALGLTVFAVLGLVGCQSNKVNSKTPGMEVQESSLAAIKVGIVYDNGGLGDKSFNDSAARGIEKAKKELGAEVIQIESKDVKDYESNLREVANQGCQLVIAVGINMTSDLTVVAKEFPETKFAIVDGDIDLANVRSLKFKEEEGSFLVGYLAGLMTKTGKVGFVGGMDLPSIRKFKVGFEAGAEEANNQVVLLPPKFTGDWVSIDDAKVAANLLFSQGADIVYHAAGRAGLGVIRSAADNKKFAIGVDSDQDAEEPGFVLTSMIKGVDNSVFDTINAVSTGTFQAGEKVYDLASGGVGMSELKHTRQLIGNANIEKVDAIYTKIKNHEIFIPATEKELKTYRKLKMSVARL